MVFLQYEIGAHRKIEGDGRMIIRTVSVDLRRCGMCGVGAQV